MSRINRRRSGNYKVQSKIQDETWPLATKGDY